tara:strand:+ start:353 stop:733 length:381 start_codon:yes stop_codon:yes gene_type:complete
MRKIILSLLFCIVTSSSQALEKEKYYSDKFCEEMSGQTDYTLQDQSRVDCLTETHAFEVDWADGMKVYEAIGQSLYYASQTGKKPGILLLIRKDNSEKHIRKVQEVIISFNLPIELVVMDLTKNNN